MGVVALVTLLMASAAWAAGATTAFTGQVVGIHDGDTIEVLYDGRAVKV